MAERFTVVLIAAAGDGRADALARKLGERTRDVAASGDVFEVVRDVAPGPDAGKVAAVVFGSRPREQHDALVAACLAAKAELFPVVADLEHFSSEIPASIAAYNGYRLQDGEDPAELVGLVLEALGLQRGRRKVFISYVRKDAAAVALQLREALTARWYTVFHDVVSIRPGREFQPNLFQELVDADVFLLLNSKHVIERPFVRDEIECAMQAGLGGVQVMWPDAGFRREGIFSTVELARDGRLEDDGTLSEAAVEAVLNAVAGERTAVQRQREAEVRFAVESYAKRFGLNVTAHPGRHIELTGPDDRAVRLDIALGLPTSAELAMAWQAVSDATANRQVVYDPLGLTRPASDHLAFLGERFPIRLLNFRESLTWPALP